MRDKTLSTIFAFFLGTFGIHRFYLGQVGLGIFYAILMFTGIPTVLGIIDALVMAGMSQSDFDHKYNKIPRKVQTKPDYQRRAESAEYDTGRSANPANARQATTIQQKQRQQKPVTRTTTSIADNVHKKNGIRKFKEFDYPGAIAEFTKALELQPRDIAVHFNLACAYSLTENVAKAYEHLKKAVSLGFNDLDKIHTHEALSYVRIQPQYLKFKDSNFTEYAPFAKTAEEEEKEWEEQNAEPLELPEADQSDLLEELRRLQNLKELGVLTDEEFLEQKRKLDA
jgi:TM2 domain-containing membrane protein YozV